MTGYVNGDYRQVYWTDGLGQTFDMDGANGNLDWYCLGSGRFNISLTAAMKDGSKHQDTHEIECV